LGGESAALVTTSAMMVTELQKILQEKFGIPAKQQRIMYNGKEVLVPYISISLSLSLLSFLFSLYTILSI
jgi:hypothetical protein